MILLDTHVLVWVNAEAQRVSAAAGRAITAAYREGGVAVAAMTLFEVATLFVRGRLQPVGTVEHAVTGLVEGMTVLPLTPAIAAIAHGLPLVTADVAN